MKNQSHFCKVEGSFFGFGQPQTRFAARVFLSSCGAFIVQSIKVTGEPSTRIMQRRGEACSAFIHFFNFTAPHFLSFFLSCRAGCRYTSTAPENSWFEEHLSNFCEAVRATVYTNSWQSASWDCLGGREAAWTSSGEMDCLSCSCQMLKHMAGLSNKATEETKRQKKKNGGSENGNVGTRSAD